MTTAWRSSGRWVASVLLVLLLASCAAPRLRPDAGLMLALEQRERTLLAETAWSLSARLAISGPQDSGSGTLAWSQDGAAFRFAVSAPVTGKTWTLSGDDGHAELSGLREQPIRASDAGTLLQRELGWHVPVRELAAWVRGLRAAGPAKVVFRADGLPAQFIQNGWTIEYKDYDTRRQPALPLRIFASKGDYRVRLAIRNWDLR